LLSVIQVEALLPNSELSAKGVTGKAVLRELKVMSRIAAVVLGLLFCLNSSSSFGVTVPAGERGEKGKPLHQLCMGILRGALNAPSPMDRIRSMEALGEIGKRAAISWVAHGLNDPNSTVRSYAAEAMARIGDKGALPYLAPALKDPQDVVRRRAVKAVGRLRGPQVIHHLLKALQDPAPEVRQEGAAAIGRTGDLDALPVLRKFIGDPYKPARIQVAKSMILLGDREGMAVLEDLWGDRDWRIRLKVIQALGELPHGVAGPLFQKALEDPKLRVRIAASRGILIRDRGR
jgi:HEAT repeat protein